MPGPSSLGCGTSMPYVSAIQAMSRARASERSSPESWNRATAGGAGSDAAWARVQMRGSDGGGAKGAGLTLR